MPARNTRKVYVEKGYYHLYNRGVEKRNVFEDVQDYEVFLSYLKTYLTPKDTNELQEHLADPAKNWVEKNKIIKLLRLNNFEQEINLLAYCLMPNHFHLLVKQNSLYSIDKFINSLNTRYVMYFNKKYKRIGPLFQGVYKAAQITTDEQLTYLSAYIHRNPINKSKVIPQGEALMKLTKQPSSLPEYMGNRNTTWVKPGEVLKFFSKKFKKLSYRNFVIGYSSLNFNLSNFILEE